MELWIPITIAAAFMQNLRSALQKHLKAELSTAGATSSRFFYAVPFAAFYLAGLSLGLDRPLPTPSFAFAAYTATGGVSQILATALLVSLFSYRNFAVGTAYSKTETVQTAIFGILILGDPLGLTAGVAILISIVGVFAITLARSEEGVASVLAGLGGKAAWIGLASGALFGVSAVSYRAASLSLGGEGFLLQAAFTLACVLVLQSLLMAAYMRAREPGELTRVFKSWRLTGLVGLTGMLGSVGWFTAMTIQNAAYVRALGQIELVFTFAASYLFFHERANRTEIIGIALIVVGIVVLLLG
jgi:drug/metabolite transporter (DMT)-like permease